MRFLTFSSPYFEARPCASVRSRTPRASFLLRKLLARVPSFQCFWPASRTCSQPFSSPRSVAVVRASDSRSLTSTRSSIAQLPSLASQRDSTRLAAPPSLAPQRDLQYSFVRYPAERSCVLTFIEPYPSPAKQQAPQRNCLTCYKSRPLALRALSAPSSTACSCWTAFDRT